MDDIEGVTLTTSTPIDHDVYLLRGDGPGFYSQFAGASAAYRLTLWDDAGV